MKSVEDQLRAMFHTDAERIQQSDLRPPATFPRSRARRVRWWPTFAAALAGAAATALVLVGPQLISPLAPGSSVPPSAAGTSQDPSLSITFTTRVTTVSPPGVSVTVPQAEVHAAAPQAAKRVSDVIEENLAYTVTAFQNRAGESIALGGDPRDMSARITVAELTTWHRYLSVRFDSSIDVETDHTIDESTALTFDTDTGARILSTDLFTDVDEAVTVVREALLASRIDDSLEGFDLAALSMQPSEEGSTPPLNCYPTPAGMHCLVDRGSLAPYPAGRIEATIPWERLAPLLRPGIGD